LYGYIDIAAGLYVHVLYGDAILDMYVGAMLHEVFLYRNVITHFVDILFVFHSLQNILTTFIIHGIFFEKMVVAHM
jgi:hypothetical protein